MDKNNERVDGLSFTDNQVVVEGKKHALSDIQSVYIGEDNPAKNRGIAIIAIGVVLIALGERWIYAGGFFAILVGIVSFFDSRSRYSLVFKKGEKDQVALYSYNLNNIKAMKDALDVKIND